MARKSFRTALALLLSFAVIATMAGSARAAGGDLDPTFGGDGKVRTDFTSRGDYVSGVAIQPDGKIVAAGAADGRLTAAYMPDKFALARYNADGTLDSTFGGDGRVTTDFTDEQDYAAGVAIQGNKIVVAGTVDRDGFRSGKFAVARYRANGTLDTTFGGGDGKVTANFTPKDDYASEMAIQPDGKIVVAGTARQLDTGVGDDYKFALARFTANGTLDSTFGGDGKVTTDFEEGWGEVLGMAIQADGKIVVAGYEGYGDTGMLVRYNADGTLDDTFGGDGGVETWTFNEVAIQADGKIVAVAGFSVARFDTDGTLDATFGEDGMARADFTPDGDWANALAIQSDGKIVAAGLAGWRGWQPEESDTLFALARFDTDGTLDSTFGGDGKVTTSFAGVRPEAEGVAIQADGKIVAAGRAGGRFAVARYLGE